MTPINPIRFTGTLKGTFNGGKETVDAFRQIAQQVAKENSVFVNLNIVNGDSFEVSVDDNGEKTTDHRVENLFVFETSSRSNPRYGVDQKVENADRQILTSIFPYGINLLAEA